MSDQTFYILSLNFYHIVLSFQFLRLSVNLIGIPPQGNSPAFIVFLIGLLASAIVLIFTNLGMLNCAMVAKSKKQAEALTAKSAFSGIVVLFLLIVATLLQSYIVYL